MRIAVVHYHLRRGGVTRVIETTLEGLADSAEVVVLTGEPPGEESPLAARCRVVPGLGYRDDDAEAEAEADTLAGNLVRVARDALGAAPDLWHFHNHSLGKNVAMPAVIHRLARDGARMLLQIHDFAEDGRPENFRRQRAAVDPDTLPWYPDAPAIHYATLNRRDADFLAGAGLARERLHPLPNAVAPPPADADAGPPEFVKSGQRFLLYPTRGIRRKNLGEMLLLAALTGDACAYASTLAPENPEWLAIHHRWEKFAARHRLPARLGIGADPAVSYGGLLGAADALLTTSVAEGFGLAFLEPWLIGKAVRGRDLPEITLDFKERGIRLEGLYPRLDLPESAIDVSLFRDRLEAGLSRAFAGYGRALPRDAGALALAAALRQGRVDFGRLDEPLQERAIEWVLAHPRRARDAIALPRLDPGAPALCRANARAVRESHGVAAYGERLGEIYRSILACPLADPGALDGDRLLDAFLDPARFSLLRS